jgi:hypothetical protein
LSVEASLSAPSSVAARPAKPDNIEGTAALAAFLVDSVLRPRKELNLPSTSPENNRSRMILTRFIGNSFTVSRASRGAEQERAGSEA